VSGVVVWFTGLPASGKTTLARAVQGAVGDRALVLDSDELRETLVPAPAYDPAGRDAFYETLARLAALVAGQQRVALVAATANLRRYRARAEELAPAWLEVHVATPAAQCAERDFKGLYSRAARDGIALPGSGAPYEPPLTPDVTAAGGNDGVALREIVSHIFAL